MVWISKLDFVKQFFFGSWHLKNTFLAFWAKILFRGITVFLILILTLFMPKIKLRTIFFLITQKPFFYWSPSVNQKRSISPEFLSPLKKSNFVIRITFLTKPGDPLLNQRMWPYTTYRYLNQSDHGIGNLEYFHS